MVRAMCPNVIRMTYYSVQSLLYIIIWKFSGAALIPNGRGLKENLPRGVWNLMNSLDCLYNEIFQKLASFTTSHRFVPTLFMGWIFLSIVLFNVKSTQILTPPFLFGVYNHAWAPVSGNHYKSNNILADHHFQFFSLWVVMVMVPLPAYVYTGWQWSRKIYIESIVRSVGLEKLVLCVVLDNSSRQNLSDIIISLLFVHS